MQPDPDKYLSYFAEYTMPETQKIEAIHALWRAMEAFVDLAFETHPVQICCGQPGRTTPDARTDTVNDID